MTHYVISWSFGVDSHSKLAVVDYLCEFHCQLQTYQDTQHCLIATKPSQDQHATIKI